MDLALKQQSEQLKHNIPQSEGVIDNESSNGMSLIEQSYEQKLGQIQSDYQSQLEKRIGVIEDEINNRIQLLKQRYEEKLESRTRELKRTIETIGQVKIENNVKDREEYKDRLQKSELEVKSGQRKLDLIQKQRDDIILNKNEDRVKLYQELSDMGNTMLMNDNEIKTLKKEVIKSWINRLIE